MSSLDLSKKFVTEDEVEEKKKQRQEEWEKVRKPEDPVDAPEEAVDHRCLYDRLQEQKLKKEEEHAETFKLKNQIRGLDEDETEFLDFVSTREQELQRERRTEEEEALNEYRSAVANQSTSGGKEAEKPVEKKQTKTVQSKSSQHKLLAGAVKRKSVDTPPTTDKKAKVGNGTNSAQGDVVDDHQNLSRPVVIGKLPGLGEYVNSSDETSDSRSEDSDVDTDIFAKHITLQIRD